MLKINRFFILFNIIVLLTIFLTIKICSINNSKIVAVSSVMPSITSESCIVMNLDTKEIYFQKNCNKIMLPASLTKVLTTITALEYMDLNQYYHIKRDFLLIEGSKVYLEENDYIKGIDLLYGIMLRSGNDASNVLAYNYGKTYNDFIIKMNEISKKIGMTSSFFINPTGLDEINQNYTTSYDLALLMSYAMQNRTFFKIVNTKKYSFQTFNKNYLLINKHKLIHENNYFIGGKTGFTKKANRTLISCFEKYQMRLVVVTLNATNDWALHSSLAEYVFDNYNRDL